MTIAAQAIATAISELCDGTLGSVRTVPATALSPGHIPWMGQIFSKPRYDVEMVTMGQHEASPVSARANFRLEDLGINITLYHKFNAPIRESQRDAVRAQALLHADFCVQAMGYPGNLTKTEAATATGIISGMLLELDRDVVDEDWDARPPMLITGISGTAIVRIPQAVRAS